MKEFFGLTDTDLKSAERLKELRVEYTETLARFSITKTDFETLFGGVFKNTDTKKKTTRAKPRKNA